MPAFLTARWANLVLANYAVPEAVVRPYLPPGVEPDFYKGEVVVSLVGFQFLDTRVLGVGWPGFRHFPEWNLRLYVRHGRDRGVVFVREFVPQRLVCAVARLIYNEPYRAAALTQNITEDDHTIRAEYSVTYKGAAHTMGATGTKPGAVPTDGSLEAFFKEQRFGYGTSHFGTLIQYEVEHPPWACYPVTDFRASVDWGQLYGGQWAPFSAKAPHSVVFAAGSAVRVYPFRRLSPSARLTASPGPPAVGGARPAPAALSAGSASAPPSGG